MKLGLAEAAPTPRGRRRSRRLPPRADGPAFKPAGSHAKTETHHAKIKYVGSVPPEFMGSGRKGRQTRTRPDCKDM